MQRSLRTVRWAALLIGMLAVSTGVAFAKPPAPNSPDCDTETMSCTLNWIGQGAQCDQYGSCVLNLELCGLAEGADVDGPYLLWVLTGKDIDSATISISGCGGETGGDMTCNAQGGGVGSVCKYVSDYCDPTTVGATVTYDYTGDGPKNPQFVISHGCQPGGEPIWCSPGYWKQNGPNDTYVDARWALVAPTYTKDTLYNSTTCKDSPAVTDDPTLYQVVSTPQTYGGDAGNCVAQLLTDTLCGGGHLNQLCPNTNEQICPDNCPYDAHGVLKDDAPDYCQQD